MTDELKPDYTTMTVQELYDAVGDDAAKWAAAFCQHAKKIDSRAPDEGWMISWFANAIEHSTIVRSARAPSVPEGWQPLSTLEHRHAYDAPLVMDGKNMPATYVSDSVILTDGKRVWVERSVIMGGALSSSADKFTAYPSGDKPTHWMPLPAAPKVPA